MIGLDTNVLVRYLTQDDPDQAALATRIVEKELTEDAPGFICLVVLIEKITHPDSKTETFTYDAFGRVTHYTNRAGRATTTTCFSSGH